MSYIMRSQSLCLCGIVLTTVDLLCSGWHSTWISKLGVQVPFEMRHFLPQKFDSFSWTSICQSKLNDFAVQSAFQMLLVQNYIPCLSIATACIQKHELESVRYYRLASSYAGRSFGMGSGSCHLPWIWSKIFMPQNIGLFLKDNHPLITQKLLLHSCLLIASSSNVNLTN